MEIHDPYMETLTADLEQLKAETVELKADIKKLNEDLETSAPTLTVGHRSKQCSVVPQQLL